LSLNLIPAWRETFTSEIFVNSNLQSVASFPTMLTVEFHIISCLTQRVHIYLKTFASSWLPTNKWDVSRARNVSCDTVVPTVFVALIVSIPSWMHMFLNRCAPACVRHEMMWIPLSTWLERKATLWRLEFEQISLVKVSLQAGINWDSICGSL